MTINFKEEFLHYVWRYRQYRFANLQTIDKQAVIIRHPGYYNTGAGPDFHDARIQIGETLWAGNVEIHTKASDWYRHGHGIDKAYDNVILHVVFEADVEVYREDGNAIPCLELKNIIEPGLVSRYRKLLSGKTGIPCKNLFGKVQKIVFDAWLDRLMVERLEAKTERIKPILEFHKNDWEATFYEILAIGFGLKANAEPFGLLARSIPLNIIRWHHGIQFQIEALFFGQSGLLDRAFNDEFPQKLKKEYQFLSNKYKLNPLLPESWKFMRMRPSGFPTLRIARFAAFVANRQKFFSFLEITENTAELIEWLNVPTSSYWESHFRFDKIAKAKPRGLGRSTINRLLINAIIPFIFLYGKMRSEERMVNKAIRWFESIKAEDNIIIRNWKDLGVDPMNAARSQALIQLKTQYCDKKRCLDCAVGAALLKPPR